MGKANGGIVRSIRALYQDRLIDREKHGQIIRTVADPDGVETILSSCQLTETTLNEKSAGGSFIVWAQ